MVDGGEPQETAKQTLILHTHSIIEQYTSPWQLGIMLQFLLLRFKAVLFLIPNKCQKWVCITNKSLSLWNDSITYLFALELYYIRREDQYDNTVAMVTIRSCTLTDHLPLTKNAASNTHCHDSILASKESCYYSAVDPKWIFRAAFMNFVQYALK